MNMQIKKIIRIQPTKENNFAKIDKEIPTSSGIYLLFDKFLELIYIGKAKNIRSRILAHCSEANNGRINILDKGTIFENYHSSCLPIGVAQYYGYIYEKDMDRRNLIETLLQLIIKTKFNNCDKYKALEKYERNKGDEDDGKHTKK